MYSKQSNTPLIVSLLNGETLDEIPVWLMRQAGRYLPEYRSLKESYTFNQLSENPELSSEVTIQPLKRFKEIDAAIFFADILTPSKALGFNFEFKPGPVLSNPIVNPQDVKNLIKLDVSSTNDFVFKGIKKVRSFLDNEERPRRRAMLGFAAAPWTLACYLIDQGIYKQHLGTKIFAEKYPEEFNALCSHICDITIEYLTLKHHAGADAVQLFDTWASLLNSVDYHDLSGKWVNKIVQALRAKGIPVIVYTQGDSSIIEKVAEFNPNGISIDWRNSLSAIRQKISSEITLQGNFDPTLLFGPEDRIQSHAVSMYKDLKGQNVIANLGHGVLPATPISSVEVFLRSIKGI